MKGPNHSIEFSIASQLEQVCLLRAAMGGILELLQVEEQDVFALVLAVTELVNNEIVHGYGGAEDQQVRVRLEVNEAEVMVTLSDTAPAFPAEERHRLQHSKDAVLLFEPDEDWECGGHGLEIVRQIVDSLELLPTREGNTLVLRKQVSLRASEM